MVYCIPKEEDHRLSDLFPSTKLNSKFVTETEKSLQITINDNVQPTEKWQGIGRTPLIALPHVI
jgi:hypothetical protein